MVYSVHLLEETNQRAGKDGRSAAGWDAGPADGHAELPVRSKVVLEWTARAANHSIADGNGSTGTGEAQKGAVASADSVVSSRPRSHEGIAVRLLLRGKIGDRGRRRRRRRWLVGERTQLIASAVGVPFFTFRSDTSATGTRKGKGPFLAPGNTSGRSTLSSVFLFFFSFLARSFPLCVCAASRLRMEGQAGWPSVTSRRVSRWQRHRAVGA